MSTSRYKIRFRHGRWVIYEYYPGADFSVYVWQSRSLPRAYDYAIAEKRGNVGTMYRLRQDEAALCRGFK